MKRRVTTFIIDRDNIEAVLGRIEMSLKLSKLHVFDKSEDLFFLASILQRRVEGLEGQAWVLRSECVLASAGCSVRSVLLV